MVPGMFLSIIGCGVPKQLHHVWLQRSADRGEGGRCIEVVLAMMEQIIEEIEDVKPPALH